MADVFEQLATTVADSTQASIAQLMTQQQEVRHILPAVALRVALLGPVGRRLLWLGHMY